MPCAALPVKSQLYSITFILHLDLCFLSHNVNEVMKIIVCSGSARSLILFRRELLRAFIGAGYEVVAMAPDHDQETEDRLKLMGIRFIQLSYARTGMNPLADCLYIRSLATLFKKEQPDRVFAYTIKAMIASGLAARIASVNRVDMLVSGAGYLFAAEPKSIRRSLLRFFTLPLLRRSLGKSRALIFQNGEDVQTYRNYRLISSGTEVLVVGGSGVDLTQFVASAHPENVIRFCMIARLIREKGVEEYVRAAKQLRQRFGSRVECLLVGPTDDTPGSLSGDEIALWSKTGAIRYLGEVRDVRPILADSAVFVLPSFYMEGVPRTLLEAMAMGRALITTDHRGCRETVVDGCNGFLVPVRDEGALYEAMECFVLEPSYIAKMGMESRRLAEKHFDVNQVTDRMMGILMAK